MIDPKEIRIGNYLLYDGKLSKVTCIDLDLDDEGAPLVSFEDNNPIELNYGRVAPIPLTRFVLEKFGFSNSEDIRHYIHDDFDEETELVAFFCGVRVGVILTECKYTNGEVFFHSCRVQHNVAMGYNNLVRPPEYLHELQNLIFALSDEDLTLKQ